MGKTSTHSGNTIPRGKHPHGRGEDPLMSIQNRADGETPPRAWGRDCVTDFALSELRNTPTGVGKRCRHPRKPCAGWKHPHGRGEESRLAFDTYRRRRNTPTGVGKRAHSNFKQFEYYNTFFPFVKELGSVCADFSIISCSPDMDVKSFVGMSFA